MTIGNIKLIEDAKNGDPVAQTSLGSMYYYGIGVKKNFVKAAVWLKKAADQNFAEAQLLLGMCYANGEGVKRNDNYAIVLLEKAYNQGCDKALEKIRDIKNKHYPKAMPQLAKDKLNEKIDDSSKGSRGKQQKRNEAIKCFPWSASKAKALPDVDLDNIRELLDDELYGLDVAKRQILRYLAVCKRNPDAPIRPVLLVGSPGTGKSSFGKIIAKAVNKPLKVISMPSISAGSDFTGTEKHWESAGCGIIVQSIIDEGEYPVFLLDEVDKAGYMNGRHSSPQNGLLNLLDDSRDNFTDVFLEVPVNLQRTILF